MTGQPASVADLNSLRPDERIAFANALAELRGLPWEPVPAWPPNPLPSDGELLAARMTVTDRQAADARERRAWTSNAVPFQHQLPEGVVSFRRRPRSRSSARGAR